jgi:excinuclease ABC subunit B
MRIAIDETMRRRHIQEEYNKEHHIVPKTIIKEIRELISNEDEVAKKEQKGKLSKKEKLDLIDRLTKEMNKAARELNFERAMELRDIIFEMESE